MNSLICLAVSFAVNQAEVPQLPIAVLSAKVLAQPIGYPTMMDTLLSNDGRTLILLDRASGSIGATEVGATLPDIGTRTDLWNAMANWYTMATSGLHVFATTEQAERANLLNMVAPGMYAYPISSTDGKSFVALAPSSSVEDEVGLPFGVLATDKPYAGWIYPLERSHLSNSCFQLPTSAGTQTIILEVRERSRSARLTTVEFHPVRVGKVNSYRTGVIRYFLLSAKGVERIPRQKLDPSERKLDGRIVPASKPCVISKVGSLELKRYPPTSADTLRGVVMYRQGCEYFDAASNAMKPLPFPRSEKRWESDVIGGRMFCWTSWSPTGEPPILYSEISDRKWKESGAVQVCGRSANGRFMLLHRPERIMATPGRFYVVEPKPLRTWKAAH